MINFEIQAFNLLLDINSIMPFTAIGSTAIIVALKILQKRLEKAFTVTEMTEQEVLEYMEESCQGELLNIREGHLQK